jgi:hypothetical protein
MSRCYVGLGSVAQFSVIDIFRRRQSPCLIAKVHDPSLSARTHRPQTGSPRLVVLLAIHDLDRTHRVKAKPLRGRFASLDPVPPVKGRQLRGGRGRSSRGYLIAHVF